MVAAPSGNPLEGCRRQVPDCAAMTSSDLRPPSLLPPAPTTTVASTSLRRLLRYLGPVKGSFIASFCCGVLAIGMTISIPLVTQRIIDGPVAERDGNGLVVLGLAALCLGLMEATLFWLRRWVIAHPMQVVEAEIRKDLYAHLQRLPMRFHSQWQSGQLLSRVMSDLSTLRRFFAFSMIFLVLNVLQIAVVIALLIRLYWPLGLFVLVAVVPVGMLVYRSEKELTRLSRAVQDQVGDVATSVEESAHGLRVIKSFGRADHVFTGFDARASRLRATSLEKVAVQARFWTFLEVIPNITLIAVLGLGAVATGQGRLSLGTLVAFITLMLSIVWPVAALGFLISMLQESMTAADRVTEVLDTPSDVVDGTTTTSGRPRGELRFEGVGFRFPDGDRDVLHDVDLHIEPGQTLALVGATGSGKTVLTGLVPRLWDVTAGRILLDGTDIRELSLDSLRSAVATAFEEPTLFSMSVRENLTLGRADASEEDIARAVDIAQAGFVHELPWGLDTRIGEQGLSLSGGQRQRLALARAVLTDPAVLVLDDTLSALDVHTEKLVEDALRSVLGGVTAIIVAHRASTVMLADRVALLDGGTITHVGSHAELLATVPEYRRLLSADEEIDPAEHEVVDPLEPARDIRWAAPADDDLPPSARGEAAR